MKNWKIWAGVGVSMLFFWLAFRNVKYRQIISSLERVDFRYLLLGIGLSMVSLYVRTMRWRYLLKPIKQIDTNRLFPVNAMGYMVNNILPLRAGEFYRAYLIGRNEKISKTSAFATIVVERTFDGLTMLIFLLAGSFFFSFTEWSRRIFNIATVFFVGLLIFLFLVLRRESLSKGIFQKIIPLFPSPARPLLTGLFHSFLKGLRVLRYGKNMALIMILSILSWLCEAAIYYVVSVSFDLELPFYAPVVLVAIVNLGITIPSSPGYLGTFEFFCARTMNLFGILSSLSISYAILMHAVVFVPVTLLGLFFMWKEHFPFKELHFGKYSD